MLKRPLTALAASVLLLGLAGCGEDDESPTATDSASDSPAAPASEQPVNPDGAPCTYVASGDAARPVEPPADRAAYEGPVEMTIELSAGDVDVTLDAAAAPCAVNSFTSLAAQGYYDGTECHRLSTDPSVQVLQCGDPTASGMGGPGYSFPDELTGEETYPPGTLAMANAGADTNGSQFFFVYGTWQLPADYTVLGQVSDDESLEVLTDIAEEGVKDGLPDGPPATPVTIEGMTVD